MGKAQYKKKTAVKRHNPIRVPDAHLGSGKGIGQAHPNKENQVLPILNKLKSPDYADRTWACAAVCNLIQNDAATRRLFQGRNIVGELVERLSDSVDEVVVEASGALRNLAIDGGHELCGEMFNKGIMPHLVVLMGKISNTIDSLSAPMTETEFQSRKHLLLLTENVISLIWSLAEASHKTLQAINSSSCEALLIRVLQQRDQLGPGATLSAVQALYSLTQDNPPVQFALSDNADAVRVLVDIAKTEIVAEKDKGKGKVKSTEKEKENGGKNEEGDEEEIGDGRRLLTRVLACGVLRNIVDPSEPDLTTLTNETIVPLVTSLLDINLQNVSSRVLELVTQIPEENTVLGKDLKTDHKSTSETKLDRIERRLGTIAIALEVLTGICAGLEDVEEVQGEQMDEDDDQEMADEDLIEMGRDPETAPSDQPMPNSFSTLIHTSLPNLSLSLPSQLTSLSLPTSLSFSPIGSPSPHPPTTAALSTVHLRALEAMNNLLLMSAAAGSKLTGVEGCWEAMFEVVQRAGKGVDEKSLIGKGQEMRLEVIEMALGCLWGLAKNSDMTVTFEQIQTLIQIASVVQSDNARTRSFETLALIASRSSVSIEQNRIIGEWLVQLLITANIGSTNQQQQEFKLSRSSDLVAVINAIIDIYADEEREFDVVFTNGGFVEKLASVVSKVRTDVRKIDRRKELELRVRADEAYENLVAFIKYRRKLRR